MQRSQALMLVRATTRLKILADRARARTAARAAEAAAEAEAGSHDDTQLHADGIDHSSLTVSLLDGAATESLRGGSPTSMRGGGYFPSLPTTPLSAFSARSAAASLMHGALSHHSGDTRLSGGASVHAKKLQDSFIVSDLLAGCATLLARHAVKEMVMASPINVLLVCVPVGIAAQLAGAGAVPVFVLNFLALIPLALLLGDVTEDLAVRFGDSVGGLLNATFGNVVEMILSIAALRAGLYNVVAYSLLGSILSNLLLVLGCCFLVGGAFYKTQSFNAIANQATSTLLFLSCIGLVLPTAAVTLDVDVSTDDLLHISRGTAVVMLFVYTSYLAFQLHTHHDLFKGEDEDEEPLMSLPGAITALSCITVAVALCSEYICGAIEAFSATTGLPQAFLAIIVLPIAGNACEHITAVMVASKNKMDLSLGVAVGSSIQIAAFAIPFVVIIGWLSGHDFTLDFDPFATLVLTVSVIHANIVTGGALSHWLMGMALISNYAIVALVFLYKN